MVPSTGVGGILVQSAPPGYTDPHNLSPETPGSNVPWMPQDNLLLACTGDPLEFTATVTTTGGAPILAKIPVRKTIFVTNILYELTTAGVGASTGSFAALFDPSGNLISASADLGTPLIGATGVLTAPLAAAQVIQPPFVWAWFVANLATTQPTLRRASTSSTASNFGATVTVARFATNGAGVSTVPATIAPASNAFTANALLVGLS